MLSVSSNEYSQLISYLFTFYSLYLIKKTEVYKSINYSPLIILIGPTIYFITGFFADTPLRVFLISSIAFCFYLTLITLFFKKVELKTFGIMVVFLGYFHVFHILPNNPFSYLKSSDKEEINAKNLNDNINLNQFDFLDSKLDTTQFSLEKPILIETWNETCSPCMASIRDLEPIIDSYSSLEHVYLYEALVDERLSNEKVVAFEKIKNKSKIFIDIHNSFRDSTSMKSYPYFMLFDKKGNLIDYFAGYSPVHSEYFEERLKEMLDKTK
jgi:thiol-disulfide isomerase/thioredoxin